MKESKKDRIRRLEARVAELEAQLAERSVDPHARIEVTSAPVDAHGLWRDQVKDYSSYADSSEGWYGTYL